VSLTTKEAALPDLTRDDIMAAIADSNEKPQLSANDELAI
jgi:hypothetical protein